MRLIIVLAAWAFIWFVDRTMFLILSLLLGAAICVMLYIQTAKAEKEAKQKQKAERQKAYKELQEWEGQFYTGSDSDDDISDDEDF